MKTINRTNYYIITIHSLFTNMYLRNFSEKKQKKKKSMYAQTRLKLINLDTLAMKYKLVVTRDMHA